MNTLAERPRFRRYGQECSTVEWIADLGEGEYRIIRLVRTSCSDCSDIADCFEWACEVWSIYLRPDKEHPLTDKQLIWFFEMGQNRHCLWIQAGKNYMELLMEAYEYVF